MAAIDATTPACLPVFNQNHDMYACVANSVYASLSLCKFPVLFPNPVRCCEKTVYVCLSLCVISRFLSPLNHFRCFEYDKPDVMAFTRSRCYVR